jgi:hypothetical protein
MSATNLPAPSSTKHSSDAHASSPRLPDFVIVGAMKAGTTTLYELLKARPDVFMADPKEPNFFSIPEVYARGIDWYADLFATARPGQICGEASPSYTRFPRFPDAAARMAQHIPHARLVYVMRHPVARFYSNYVFERAYGLRDSIRETLVERPYVLATSDYMGQIRRLLEFFPREQLHLVILDDLRPSPQAPSAAPPTTSSHASGSPQQGLVEVAESRNIAGSENRELQNGPARTIIDLWNFLGLTASGDDAATLLAAGPANERGRQHVVRQCRGAIDALRSAPGVSAAKRLLPASWKATFRTCLLEKLPDSRLGRLWASRQADRAEPLTAEMRRELLARLDESTRELEQFLGRDLSHWRA